jgi:hypothetical protein
MDKSAEALFRATLHDLANVLGGVRGIMELNSPGQPMTARDHDRLVSVVEEGIATLDRCRHLVLATLPEAGLEPGTAWRQALAVDMGPLGILFRCRFDLSYQGDPRWDRWPGRLLRSYVRAVTRQVLPVARPAAMSISGGADADGWWLRWEPVPVLPDSLVPGPGDGPMDVSARWAARVGAFLGASLALEGGALMVRLPGPGPDGNPSGDPLRNP